MMNALPVWNTYIIAALAVGVLLLIVVLALAAVAYTVMRRNADGRRELAELRQENARLRREVERLKDAHGNAGSTAIKTE